MTVLTTVRCDRHATRRNTRDTTWTGHGVARLEHAAELLRTDVVGNCVLDHVRDPHDRGQSRHDIWRDAARNACVGLLAVVVVRQPQDRLDLVPDTVEPVLGNFVPFLIHEIRVHQLWMGNITCLKTM